MKDIIRKIAISAVLTIPLVFFTTDLASADSRSANEPRCAGGAHWSWSDMRCKGGTGDHHEHHNHDHHHKHNHDHHKNHHHDD